MKVKKGEVVRFDDFVNKSKKEHILLKSISRLFYSRKESSIFIGVSLNLLLLYDEVVLASAISKKKTFIYYGFNGKTYMFIFKKRKPYNYTSFNLHFYRDIFPCIKELERKGLR